MDSVVLTFEVIIGILCCLFGFKFQKVVISLIGCVLGFRLGSWIVNYFAITGGLETVLKFGLLLVVGACSLSLFESLISIVTGLSIFVFVVDIFKDVWYGYLIGVVLGVIGGLLVHKFYRLGVVIATSLIGSYLVTNGIYTYFNISYMVLFGIILVASLLFQIHINKIIK